MRKALAALIVAYAAIFLGGCASMLASEPTKVNPVDAKYIDAETALKNSYKALGALADKEIAARLKGAPKGSVIERVDFFNAVNRLDEFAEVLRHGRALIGHGACLQLDRYKALGVQGCFKRDQIVVLVLAALTKYNEGGSL